MEQLLLHILTQICDVKFGQCLNRVSPAVCDSRETCAADENAVRGCQIEYQVCLTTPKVQPPKKTVKLRK